MASGDDYYKDYKRKLRESRKANRKVGPIIAVVSIFLVVCVSTFLILAKINSEEQNEEPNSIADANESHNETNNTPTPQQKKTEQTEETPSVTVNQNPTTNQPTANQNTQQRQSASAPSQNQNDNNDEAYRKLMEQMQENEREKQRIAEEQAAAQLAQACNTIKTNMNSELKSAMTTYNNAVQEASMACSGNGQGGCPAVTQAKNRYDSSVNSIKSNYLDQWQKTGCSGNLY